MSDVMITVSSIELLMSPSLAPKKNIEITQQFNQYFQRDSSETLMSVYVCIFIDYNFQHKRLHTV